MKRSSLTLWPLLLSLASLGAGCIRGTRPAPDLLYLDVQPGSVPEALAPSQEVLLLRRLDVQSPYDDRRFVYRTGSGTYESDYYVRFAAPPAEILTDRVEHWLAESGLCQAVVEPGTRVEYRYVLEGEVLELYGDYTNPQQPRAVLKLEFVLVDDLEGAGKIVFSKQYRRAEPMGSPGARSLAGSWGSALRAVLLELTIDLKGSLNSAEG